MFIKNIICDVDPNLKNAFSIAQSKWNDLKNCNGFMAQFGGWNSKNKHQAFITSVWENEEFYNNFMNNTHDLIVKNSNQNKTYISIKVTFHLSDKSEDDFVKSIQKSIKDKFFYIDTIKVLLVESWIVLDQKFK